MRVYQERIVYVFAYDLILIRIYIIYVVCNENSFSLPSLRRLRNPKIFVMRLLLTLHKMIVKVAIFFWKHKWIRNDVKWTFSMNFLHSKNILCKFVLAGNFKRVWKMIDFLIFIQSFINIWLWWSVDPHHVPVMTLCVVKSSCF